MTRFCWFCEERVRSRCACRRRQLRKLGLIELREGIDEHFETANHALREAT